MLHFYVSWCQETRDLPEIFLTFLGDVVVEQWVTCNELIEF